MSSAFRISIGANLLLAGIVAALLWRDQPAAPSRNPAFPHSETSGTRAIAEAPQPESHGPEFTPATIAELERIGFSRETSVNVLLEDLNRRCDQRVRDLQKQYAPKLVPDREYLRLSRQSDEERIRELKKALGEEGYLAWDKEQSLRELNRLNDASVPMTAEEAEQAYRLQKEFAEKNKELQMAMEDGVADGVDIGALQAQAREALDRELEKLLGSQRFNEIRGIVDPITEVNRMFGDLNPTPDQGKAVLIAEQDYRARESALAERLNTNPADPANIPAELEAMNNEREENLRRIFGGEAYDTMTRQNDPTYKTLRQYAKAWELNDHEIQFVYETLRPFQSQAERLRQAAEMREAAGQRVNWREIDSVIEKARQQTEIALQNLIGGEGLQRLKQNELLAAR
jgi:hypothetical protein